MKSLANTAKLLSLSLAIAGLASCSGSDNNNANTSAAPAIATEGDAPAAALINIRYIDEDSVSAHYNLSKDFQESYIRAIGKMENARQARAQEIQRFGSQIEEKMRSNGYLSEASYNADVQKLNKMQQDAEAYMAQLQRTTEQELQQQNLQLRDSLQSFIKDYNATKGYDAILLKAAGLYFNPALDITNEVIEGLNARYNKVATK